MSDTSIDTDHHKCEAICTSRYWRGRRCSNYATEKVGDKWQSCTDLGVSYQVLTSLCDLRLVENRILVTSFPDAPTKATQWRKAV